ncbi:MAG: heme NO-binding domain-containing protein [Bacteroidota bacterium]
MNGIVNKAIEGLIVEKHGQDSWLEVLAKSSFTEHTFSILKNYPDDITFNLAAVASDHLGVPLGGLLLDFGKYWVTKVGMERYSMIIRSGGGNFTEFMLNLPQFHSRVMLTFPDIVPPEFIVNQESENIFILHYYSTRSGLIDFLEGIILGLSDLFESEIIIERKFEKSLGADHDVLSIKLVKSL